MYHFRTRAYAEPQEGRTEANLPPISKTRSLPHSSSVPRPSFSRTMFVNTPNMAAIIRPSKTMPDQEDDMMEVKRTSSGGLLFRRKRSVQEQKEISRSRAQELSALYELSDYKEDKLNKEANIKRTITGAPRLSASMSAKEAAAAYQLRRPTKKKADPLLTDRERKQQEHQEEIERRKAAMEARKSPMSQLSRPPCSHNQFSTEPPTDDKAPHAVNKPRNWKRQEMERAEASFQNMVESEGMEAVPVSPTAYSVAPTEASTPSPRGYHASNGMVYHVPNMC